MSLETCELVQFATELRDSTLAWLKASHPELRRWRKKRVEERRRNGNLIA